jgi:putative tricarboxylic transport membrane protein
VDREGQSLVAALLRDDRIRKANRVSSPLSENAKSSDVSKDKQGMHRAEHSAGPGSQGNVSWRAELAAAIGILLLGIALGVGSFGIPPGAGYDRIGPRFFPSVVAAGLVMLGVWLGVAALRATRTGSQEATNWEALGYMAAGLVAGLALLERVGFVIASSVLFWVTARGFGSRKSMRDAVIAVGLSVVVYVAFTRGLGLVLP